MGLLNKLGGRHRLLGNVVTRNLARGAVRMNIGHVWDVAESFRGVFRFRGHGVSACYELGPRDSVGELLYWCGLKRLEPSTVPVFIELARKSRGILDVGSNTGLYALLACAANPAAKVFAWEPAPYLAGKLRANIALNGFGSRCECREAAVASSDGQADFYISDDATMSSLSVVYASDFAHTATKTTVRMERVDAVVPVDCPIDLMKVDVEGYEFEALSGATGILRRWQPAIIFECLPRTAPGPIETLLREIGYSIHRLSSGPPVEIESISASPSGDNNYLATSSASMRVLRC